VRAGGPRFRTLALAALGLGAALSAAALLSKGPTPETLLRDVIEQTGVAGGVAAWGRPGDTPRLAAAGLADKTTSRSMSVTDRFPVASLTKPVTAALVLDSVDAGLLTLDTPISAFDAAAPADVTVGQALAHLGGWDRSVAGDPFFRPLPDDLARNREDGVTECRDLVVLPEFAPSIAPGPTYAYSNVGYCWLGQIFDDAGGFAAALAATYGEAFSLDLATATVAPGDIDPEARDLMVLQPGVAGPFGGIVTEAASYLAFALEPVDARTLTPPPGAWETNYYGLGWRVWPKDGTVYLTHYGSMPGVFSFVIRRIDGGAAVLLINGSVAGHESLARSLAELLMEMPAWQ
jgi:CubicO group peptidase (beta-lactamase class C family)